MPKFSESEKEIIQDKLYIEGERLFTLYGVKKVTVDDLVKAAGIAKGSFYAFYTNKEHLYIDIAGRLQEKMWRELNEFLIEHQSLPPVELTKQCFIKMFSELKRYPMLKQADSETADYLYRKLPQEAIAAHSKDDSRHLIKLQEYGVNFKCDIELATKVLQTLSISFLNLQQDGTQNVVMEIILDGVLKEIIGDEND